MQRRRPSTSAAEPGKRNGADAGAKERRTGPGRALRPRPLAALDKRTLALDRRRSEFLRYEALRSAIVADLGGQEAVTTAEAQIADKAAFIAMQLELMQAVALADQEIDLALFGALSDRMRRLLESVGLKRRSRDITPSPLDYARARAMEVEAS